MSEGIALNVCPVGFADRVFFFKLRHSLQDLVNPSSWRTLDWAGHPFGCTSAPDPSTAPKQYPTLTLQAHPVYFSSPVMTEAVSKVLWSPP